jgi:PBP4 family serine-type D-alanyl-D-alanine carboxypeptidase
MAVPVSLRIVVVLILLWCAVLPAFGGDSHASSLSLYTENVLNERGLTGASFGIEVYSLSGDSIVYSREADRLLIPASVTKMLTSAAALDALGADFRFTTVCLTSGTLSADGTLSGDLILEGGGDPTANIKMVDPLRESKLSVWADSLYAHGLRNVSGNLVMRTSAHLLEGVAARWELGDINGGFAPPVDGFGFNSNVCHLEILPGSTVGSDALYTLDPPFAPVHVKSRVLTTRSDAPPAINFQIEPEDTSVLITGEIPFGNRGQFLWVPVQDPALYFGRAFRDVLQKKGLSIGGDVIVDRSIRAERGPGTLFFVHPSPPLPNVLAVMNKESDNYLSEYVLHALSLSACGIADRRCGLQAVTNFVAKCGVPKTDLILEDGCGLARQNLVSAHALTQVLRTMHAHPLGEVYKSTLSISGIDGTLQGRLGGADYAGRMHGKTGSMTHVSTIAGYVTTRSGETLAVAILCNNFRTSLTHIRRVQDRILEQVMDGLR